MAATSGLITMYVGTLESENTDVHGNYGYVYADKETFYRIYSKSVPQGPIEKILETAQLMLAYCDKIELVVDTDNHEHDPDIYLEGTRPATEEESIAAKKKMARDAKIGINMQLYNTRQMIELLEKENLIGPSAAQVVLEGIEKKKNSLVV